MSRTTLLQERRMQTFQNVLGHWQARRLSALEAAEMLGMSERSFRRYRRRYEDDGLDGLFDRRLDKASARRVHEYPDGTLALFHRPRCLARYNANGEPIETPSWMPMRPSFWRW